MDIVFCAPDETSANALAGAVVESPLVDQAKVQIADITTLRIDAVVSPANSFGFMDGGVDLAYSQAFGWQVQQRLQGEINKLPFGELLVGQALAVPTDDAAIPWLIAAPTMRIPGIIRDPLVIYLASRAAMFQAADLKLKSIAFPGMGTGTGGISFDLAAKLMIQGLVDAQTGRSDFPKSIRDALLKKNPMIGPSAAAGLHPSESCLK